MLELRSDVESSANLTLGQENSPLPYELPSGDGATLRLDLPTSSVVADCAYPRAAAIPDTVAAVRAALESPINFPPLEAIVVPGDHITIALAECVPQAGVIVEQIIRGLRERCEVGSISVLLADDDELARRDLELARPAADIHVHDSRSREALSYLAAAEDGKPIYLNRLLCDADVVLPVGVQRLDESLDYFGIHAGLFPTFSDEATQTRFRSPSTHDWAAHQRRRREEVRDAARLLGVQLTLQVIPGPRNTILRVVSGEGETLAAASQQFCRSAWLHEIPQSAELVLASIEGSSQSWDYFARSLYSASQAVVDGGAIVLCTALNAEPGPALKRLSHAASKDEAVQEIRRDRSKDATAASILAEVSQRARVYLLSQLDRDPVEELGIGFVAETHDIQRLARQASTCVILGNAQHALISRRNGVVTQNH